MITITLKKKFDWKKSGSKRGFKMFGFEKNSSIEKSFRHSCGVGTDKNSTAFN